MLTMTGDPRNTAAQSAPAAAPRFDAIVAPHLQVLFRVARSVSPNPYDAEDLVQDTLLRAFRSMDTFDGRYPRAWLLTIMRNANINRHRRQRPTLLRDGSDMAGEIDRRNTPSPSAEDEATATDHVAWIAFALGSLSPKLRQVVQLVDIDALSYDDAAAALGIPAGTVMSRLHRARHRMRAHLTNHPDFRSGQP